MNETGSTSSVLNRNDADSPLKSSASPAPSRSRKASEEVFEDNLEPQELKEEMVTGISSSSRGRSGHQENENQEYKDSNNPHTLENMHGRTLSNNSISGGIPDVTVSALTVTGLSPQRINTTRQLGASSDVMPPTMQYGKTVVRNQGPHSINNDGNSSTPHNVTSNENQKKTTNVIRSNSNNTNNSNGSGGAAAPAAARIRNVHIVPVGGTQETTPTETPPKLSSPGKRLVDERTGGCSGFCGPRVNVSFLHGFRDLFSGKKKKKKKNSHEETNTAVQRTREAELEATRTTAAPLDLSRVPPAATTTILTSTTNSTNTENMDLPQFASDKPLLRQQQQQKAQHRYQDTSIQQESTTDHWSEDEQFVEELEDGYGIYSNREVGSAEDVAVESREQEGQIIPTIHSSRASSPHSAVLAQNKKGKLIPTSQEKYISSGLLPENQCNDENDAMINSNSSLCFLVEEEEEKGDVDNNNNNHNESHSEGDVNSSDNIKQTETASGTPRPNDIMEVPVATPCPPPTVPLTTTTSSVLLPSSTSQEQKQQNRKQLQGEEGRSQSTSVPRKERKWMHSTSPSVNEKRIGGIRGRRNDSNDNDKNDKNKKEESRSRSGISTHTASILDLSSPQRNAPVKNRKIIPEKEINKKKKRVTSSTGTVKGRGTTTTSHVGSTFFSPSSSSELRAKQKQKQKQERHQEGEEEEDEEENEGYKKESKFTSLVRRGMDKKKTEVSMTRTSPNNGSNKQQQQQQRSHPVNNTYYSNSNGSSNGGDGTVRSTGGGSYVQLAAKRREYINAAMETVNNHIYSQDGSAPPFSTYPFTATHRVSGEQYVGNDGLGVLTPAQRHHMITKHRAYSGSSVVKSNSSNLSTPRCVSRAGLTWREFKARFYDSDGTAKSSTASTAAGCTVGTREPTSETQEQYQRKEENELSALAACVRPSCAACGPDTHELLLLGLLAGANKETVLVNPVREELYAPPPPLLQKQKQQQSQQQQQQLLLPILSARTPVTAASSPRRKETITVSTPPCGSVPSLSSYSREVDGTTPVENHIATSWKHNFTSNAEGVKTVVEEDEKEPEEKEEEEEEAEGEGYVSDGIEGDVPLSLHSSHMSKATLNSPDAGASVPLSLPAFTTPVPVPESPPFNYDMNRNDNCKEYDDHNDNDNEDASSDHHDHHQEQYQKDEYLHTSGEEKEEVPETRSPGEIPEKEKYTGVDPRVIAEKLDELDAMLAHRFPSLFEAHFKNEKGNLTDDLRDSEKNTHNSYSGVTLPTKGTVNSSNGVSRNVKSSANHVLPLSSTVADDTASADDGIHNRSSRNIPTRSRTKSNSNNTGVRDTSNTRRSASVEGNGVEPETHGDMDTDMDMQRDDKSITKKDNWTNNKDATLEEWLDERRRLEEKLIAVSAERNLLADQLRICNLYDKVKKSSVNDGKKMVGKGKKV